MRKTYLAKYFKDAVKAAPRAWSVPGGPGRRRDGGTEGRRDGGTEGRKGGGAEGGRGGGMEGRLVRGMVRSTFDLSVPPKHVDLSRNKRREVSVMGGEV